MCEEKRVLISVRDALDLLEAYDGWLGSINPDDWDEYLGRFDSLRDKLDKYKEKENV